MNVKTITLSLKQHGLGVVGSSVNACYKVLSAVSMGAELLFLFLMPHNVHT